MLLNLEKLEHMVDTEITEQTENEDVLNEIVDISQSLDMSVMNFVVHNLLPFSPENLQKDLI